MTAISYFGSDGCLLHATVVGAVPLEAIQKKDIIVVLLHGGGPDHQSLLPLAERLVSCCTVVLPDIRGYGRSICTDPSRHTWAQYAEDVIYLLNHLGVHRAVVGGAGLGTTIALRTASAYGERVRALVLLSVEDIEDDEAKQAEIAFMDAFATRVRTQGIEAAWEPILQELPPVIGAMVRDAIPRSDPASIAAAAAIGHDRSFRSIDELAAITVPTLIIPGADWRHPAMLAEKIVRVLSQGRVAKARSMAELQSADDFARAYAPLVQEFLTELRGGPA